MNEPVFEGFGPDYYACCSENYKRKRKSRWFTNMPLSPEAQELKECKQSSGDFTPNVDQGQDKSTNNKSEFEAKIYNAELFPGSTENSEVDHSIEEEVFSDYNPNTSSNYEFDDEFMSDLENENVNIPEKHSRTSEDYELIEGKAYAGNSSIMSQPSVEDILGELKQNGEKRKGHKKKDFCKYCETYVLNFARHILGTHSHEFDIQKIMCLPPKSKTRRNLLTALRKEFNFLNSSNIRKPIRQPESNITLLPCTNCMGFFSSKQLWRHRKKCMKKNDRQHQAKGQNLLLRNSNVDKKLQSEVFPRMRPDEISMVAKTDLLITTFGARYYKSHREKHSVNVTSRKMRELARLLIELKKLNSSIKNFFDALKPQHFEILISATKSISNYDEENDIYKSASTALNMGTTIKQCCQIAILSVLKRKELHSTVTTAEAEADLRSLSKLIESEWRFEVSTHAANDLNSKRWNKLTMVPLASDLKLLKTFLLSKAKSAIERLRMDPSDRNSYVILMETVFCRVLLLNRRRPGELQRIPLHLYDHTANNQQNYEEFNDIITPCEKILINSFKRIVIRGKRGRGVPVLFSKDVQDHIGILLDYRKQFLSKNNNFLFGNPNTIEPICGYKIIKKYAVLSGARNPQAITATKLRKHLATMTQVLNMSNNDLEQLSTFMGHTVDVHRGSYRLPDDIFQTAKVSKLLMLMERGEANQHKGKSLDEIDLDLDIEFNSDEIEEPEHENTVSQFAEAESTLPSCSKVNNSDFINLYTETIRKKTSQKKNIAWTDEQKQVTLKYFATHLIECRPPKKNECISLKQTFPLLLENKDWPKIKVFVQNAYVKKKRHQVLRSVVSS